MKIVNLEKFLKLPVYTLFAKYKPCVFGPLQIKGDSLIESNDFFETSLHDAIEANDSDEFHDLLIKAEKYGVSLSMCFEYFGRDALFEPNQLFAIYETEDISKLVVALEKCK